MVDITYMDNKKEVDRLKGSKPRVNYCSGLAEIANNINNSERWVCFDHKEDVSGNDFYYYQDRISHCNAIIRTKDCEEEKITLLAKFSFVEEKVLKETCQELGLQTEEI